MQSAITIVIAPRESSIDRVCALVFLRMASAAGALSARDGCSNEGGEERMRIIRATLEIWVELAADDVRMILEFDDLLQSLFRASSTVGTTSACAMYALFCVYLICLLCSHCGIVCTI